MNKGQGTAHILITQLTQEWLSLILKWKIKLTKLNANGQGKKKP